MDDAEQASELIACGADVDGLCRRHEQRQPEAEAEAETETEKARAGVREVSSSPTLTVLQLAQALDSKAVLGAIPAHTARDARIREAVVEQQTEAALRQLYLPPADTAHEDAQAKRAQQLEVGRTIVRVHRAWLQRYSSTQVALTTGGMLSSTRASEPPRCTGAQCVSAGCPRGNLMSFVCEWRIWGLNLGDEPGGDVVRIDAEDAGTWIWEVGMCRGYRDAPETVKTLLHTKCLICEAPTENIRYRPRSTLADLKRSWEHVAYGGRGSEPEPTCLCGECLRANQRVPRFRGFPAGSVEQVYCTNGEPVPAQEQMAAWFYPPAAITYEDFLAKVGAGGYLCVQDLGQELDHYLTSKDSNGKLEELKQYDAEKLDEAILDELELDDETKAKFHEQLQALRPSAAVPTGTAKKTSDGQQLMDADGWRRKRRRDSLGPLSEHALQECRDCFRPFAPQSYQGRVAEHYHCATCNERVCSFCRGPPADPFLIFALQRLSLAKFASDRLVENSCVAHLDFDVVEQSLAPLLCTGCFNLGLLLDPVKRTATLREEVEGEDANPLCTESSTQFVDALPAGTLVSVGPVVRVQSSSLWECDNAHALSRAASHWATCDYCGLSRRVFQCDSCDFTICQRCAPTTRVKPGDPCEVCQLHFSVSH